MVSLLMPNPLFDDADTGARSVVGRCRQQVRERGRRRNQFANDPRAFGGETLRYAADIERGEDRATAIEDWRCDTGAACGKFFLDDGIALVANLLDDGAQRLEMGDR